MHGPNMKRIIPLFAPDLAIQQSHKTSAKSGCSHIRDNIIKNPQQFLQSTECEQS